MGPFVVATYAPTYVKIKLPNQLTHSVLVHMGSPSSTCFIFLHVSSTFGFTSRWITIAGCLGPITLAAARPTGMHQTMWDYNAVLYVIYDAA